MSLTNCDNNKTHSFIFYLMFYVCGFSKKMTPDWSLKGEKKM